MISSAVTIFSKDSDSGGTLIPHKASTSALGVADSLVACSIIFRPVLLTAFMEEIVDHVTNGDPT